MRKKITKNADAGRHFLGRVEVGFSPASGGEVDLQISIKWLPRGSWVYLEINQKVIMEARASMDGQKISFELSGSKGEKFELRILEGSSVYLQEFEI